MRHLCIMAFSAALILAGSAGDARFLYGRDPGLTVNVLSATSVEVIEARGAGPQDMWCAAARYVDGVLGIQRGRLYVSVPRGPATTVPGRTGVTFTTEPTPNAFTSVSVSVDQAGMNLPIFHALQFCRNYILELED